MRLLFIGAIACLGFLYGLASYHVYREERAAETPTPGAFHRHPEANLRVLREAFEQNDFSNALRPNLERALAEAPAFYQSPFLMAAYLSNRLDEPERIRAAFEAALRRYPKNGRLHLTYTEWLLSPRPPAPYRRFREEPSEERRLQALDHLREATRLEPELTETALDLLVRFRVPIEAWQDHLPRTEVTELLLLAALDRSQPSRDVRTSLLRAFLDDAETMALQQRITLYARKWRERDIALEAADRWRQSALALGAGPDVVRATTSHAALLLEADESDAAYALIRETLETLEARSLPAEVSVSLLSNVGASYLNHGRRTMAQAFFTEAVALSPYHVPSRMGLARIFKDGGDLEAARLELEEVLRLDPANGAALGMLTDILEARER